MRTWILLAVALGGCDARPSATSSRVTPGDRRDPRTVIVGRPADAISLDPAIAGDNESIEVVAQIYDTLITFDPETQSYRGSLAKSWRVSEGGTVWTFRLRRGIRFHDGTPLDADAVVFSLARQRDPKHPFHGDRNYAYWQAHYRYVEKIEAVDSRTVRITIERPYAPFEANMAIFPVAIVSPTAVKRWGDSYGAPSTLPAANAPVGTGPFRFVSWQEGRIVLERNPHYWGQAPQIDRLVFQAIPDGRQRLVGLESGALDIAYSILPAELQFVKLHPELVLHRAAANNVVYLAMNMAKPAFADVRVRYAVNHAVNKVPIVKLAYQGLAKPARGPLPPGQWASHAGARSFEFDRDKAKQLLAAAAADGTFDPTAELELYVPTTPRPYLPDPVSIGRVLAANLEAVGIKTRVINQRFEDHLYDLRRGAHDLCLHGWVGDNSDPDNFLFVLFDGRNAIPGSARNVAFFRDPELDGILTLAQESEAREERRELYERAQELIADAAPWAPIAHTEIAIAARRDLVGIRPTPSTHILYKDVRRAEQ